MTRTAEVDHSNVLLAAAGCARDAIIVVCFVRQQKTNRPTDRLTERQIFYPRIAPSVWRKGSAAV